MAGGPLQGFLVVPGGILAIVALLLVDAGRLGVALGLLGGLRGVAGLVDQELEVPVAVAVALGDGLQGPDGAQVPGVGLQRPAIGLLGALGVEEHVLEDGAHANVDLHRVLRSPGDAGLAAQHVERQVPVAAALVEPAQGGDRLARVGIELEGRG